MWWVIAILAALYLTQRSSGTTLDFSSGFLATSAPVAQPSSLPGWDSQPSWAGTKPFPSTMGRGPVVTGSGSTGGVGATTSMTSGGQTLVSPGPSPTFIPAQPTLLDCSVSALAERIAPARSTADPSSPTIAGRLGDYFNLPTS